MSKQDTKGHDNPCDNPYVAILDPGLYVNLKLKLGPGRTVWRWCDQQVAAHEWDIRKASDVAELVKLAHKYVGEKK